MCIIVGCCPHIPLSIGRKRTRSFAPTVAMCMFVRSRFHIQYGAGLTEEMLAVRRRTFIGGSAASGAAMATLSRPAPVRAQSASTLRYIAPLDLTFLDPHFSSSWVARNHAYKVFDTLYGLDGSFAASPQMAAGHTVESNGRQWRIRLRDGLRWHDGTPVLARDCVASIKRWAVRDSYVNRLRQATDELTAPDDKAIQFRLKAPFPTLPAALGKVSTFCCMMLPERLATDAYRPLTEIIGSGVRTAADLANHLGAGRVGPFGPRPARRRRRRGGWRARSVVGSSAPAWRRRLPNAATTDCDVRGVAGP